MRLTDTEVELERKAVDDGGEYVPSNSVRFFFGENVGQMKDNSHPLVVLRL